VQLGVTPLMLAADTGHVDILAILLKVKTINCKIVDSDGYTALILAAQKHNPGAVRLLCEHDPSSDHLEMANKFGKTSLFLAAEEGDLESLSILVTYGAKPNVFSIRKLSPLMMTTTLNRVSTFAFLMDQFGEQFWNDHVEQKETDAQIDVLGKVECACH
jgi:ankyrin repeat protein